MASQIRPLDELIAEAVAAFEKRFGSKPSVAARAPGRVNLIGEHTDYNNGFVLPMALPMFTVIVGNPTAAGICRVETLSDSTDEPRYTQFPITELKRGTPKWANYVKGVAAQMPGKIPSFDAVIVSSVPLGGGVSSSASVEVAVYTFLEEMGGAGDDVPTIEKILSCQKAEHVFANMPCGIMDQYIAMMAKEGHALLIDCRSQQGRLVPMTNSEVVVLVTNSNVKHELTGSEYPTRRKQCEAAAQILGVQSLRDATELDLEAKKAEMDEEMFRRVRHVITEIRRTEEAASALENGDYESFGNFMVASHKSLRDDYEVSCKELDQLVEFALEMKPDGVYGSRMTGGGFGGCTVTLMKAEAVNKVISHIDSKYKAMGNKATFFVCPPSDGASKIKLSC
ncbi:unnamed protein product [Lymnaea stagnalis]|uniref:Galactokinase n=1 Tax=Lymnaea stagnalis TaxID=6523 RepID=A0AAV2I575_LYMST